MYVYSSGFAVLVDEVCCQTNEKLAESWGVTQKASWQIFKADIEDKGNWVRWAYKIRWNNSCVTLPTTTRQIIYSPDRTLTECIQSRMDRKVLTINRKSSLSSNCLLINIFDNWMSHLVKNYFLRRFTNNSVSQIAPNFHHEISILFLSSTQFYVYVS